MAAEVENLAVHGMESELNILKLELPSPEACVICLERISEKAIALPCKHDQFDFGCLGTWLHQQKVCPLCKSDVTAVKYDLSNPKAGTIFQLPVDSPHAHPGTASARRQSGNGHVVYNRRNGRRERDSYRPHGRQLREMRDPPLDSDAALAFRRRVYQSASLSLRVGTNRISRYQNFTPTSFKDNPHLIDRAKIWVRRELSVFDFLNPASSSYGISDRRASNAEFLLEYVIGILKSIDIRGSSGQAEELLKDFLGRQNTRIFLHELESWLRSPYEKLEDWDRKVQYPGVAAKVSSRTP